MIKKIGIDGLRPGMYVSGLEKDGSTGVMFFVNNILVNGERDIKRFVKSGYRFAYVEAEDEFPSEAPPFKEYAAVSELKEEPSIGAVALKEDGVFDMHSEEEEGTQILDAVEFHEAIKEAKEVKEEAQEIVRGFMANAVMGKEIEIGAVNDSVGRMVGSIFKNRDALTSLARLKSFDDYTFTHSVNVCILSIAIGRHMGLDESPLHDLGVGAVLHDIGKMLVPESILKKPGALSEAEFAEIKKHPCFGAEILDKTRGIKDESRCISLHHHERFDGSGYAQRLSGEDIHIYARIAAVADTYDAMTSNRVYQKGMPPEEALKKMYTMRGAHFEPELVERLIRCLGIYPIGTLVELNTGELATVRSLNRSHPLQPSVLMVFDKEGRRLPRPFEVDLKDEIGRWVAASKDPSLLGPEIQLSP